MSRYVIACGGTGGHLSPGIAIAEELTTRGDDCILLVSKKSIDTIMLAKYPQYRYISINAKPLGKGLKNFFAFVFCQIYSFCASLRLILHEKVDCVVGMGGFTSVPITLAAFCLRKKIVLHEANRIFGRSIHWLSYLADVIFLPPGVVFSNRFLNKKVVHAQLPVRKEIIRSDTADAKKAFGFHERSFVLTILGGSQGANALTQWARQNLEILNSNNISVCCIQGPKYREEILISNANPDAGIKNIFLSFCDNISLLLSATDLLICRSGAGTIAEAAELAIPMILVPYPSATDNHQVENARYAEENHMAMVVMEKNLQQLIGLVLAVVDRGLSDFKFDENNKLSSSSADIVDSLQKLLSGYEL